MSGSAASRGDPSAPCAQVARAGRRAGEGAALIRRGCWSRWRCAMATSCASAIWRGSTGRAENLVGHHLRALRGAGLASSRRDAQDRLLRPHGRWPRFARRAPRARRAGHAVSTPSARASRRSRNCRPRRGRRADSSHAERDRLIHRAKAVVAEPRLYVRRGRDRHHRSDPRQLRRAARFRTRLSDRGARIGDRRLALHRHPPTVSEHAERRAQRLVAVTFFLLAPYIAQDAIRTLVNGEHPGTSWLGIGLSMSSIIVMPLLGRAKQRIGHRLGSGATAGEGAQNMLCAYLAAGVLTGLVLNAAFGLWWADPAVALGIAVLALNEGRETWRAKDAAPRRRSPERHGTRATTTAAPDGSRSRPRRARAHRHRRRHTSGSPPPPIAGPAPWLPIVEDHRQHEPAGTRHLLRRSRRPLNAGARHLIKRGIHGAEISRRGRNCLSCSWRIARRDPSYGARPLFVAAQTRRPGGRACDRPPVSTTGRARGPFCRLELPLPREEPARAWPTVCTFASQ